MSRVAEMNRMPQRFLSELLIVLTAIFLVASAADASFTVSVQGRNLEPVAGFRWLIEEDNTNQPTPKQRTAQSIGLDIHQSHSPVAATGHAAGSSVVVEGLPATKNYYISIMPDAGYSLGGAPLRAGEAAVTVTVNPMPIPTAQIFILAFNDNWPINNAFDKGTESGLEGWKVFIDDAYGGGPVSMDAFGNPLGTTYAPDGTVEMMGNGIILTDANGEAVIKYLYPGKYGVRVIAPGGEASSWIQTATIEGTQVIDAWVKANEPKLFVEGFGTGTHHVQFGFINPPELKWRRNGTPTPISVTGRNLYNHFGRPPFNQLYTKGMPVPECRVALNDPVTGEGLAAAVCDGASNFSIAVATPGTYQLVTWDKPLGALFGFNTITVPAEGANVGDILSFKWFGHLEGRVFYDANANGFREPSETLGLSQVPVNIRYRNGALYQTTVTDDSGEYSLAEVFPFFKWLITEVDFARYRATGMTAAFDEGGTIPAADPMDDWMIPSFGKLNPVHNLATATNAPEVNPLSGNNYSRTESGAVLSQAMHLFLGQANVIDWGKKEYEAGENGGISGVVYYAVTRAEDHAFEAGPETWEPGIPRVQVNLYRDANGDGAIDDLNGDGAIQADVDNHPLGWSTGGARGLEDVDRNGNGTFDAGDAVNVTWSDSFDDNQPEGCYQVLPVIDGQPAKECFDNYGTWNQVRPGVFDGGYAFTSYFPGGKGSGSAEVSPLATGYYIVEAVPPRDWLGNQAYQIQKEEDKNVDFGEELTAVRKVATLPSCVGDLHTVPDELALFPGVPVKAGLAGTRRALCDRKQVTVADGRNTASDFFMFTEVPKAARAVGFVNNDLAPEFDPNSPIFGEKSSPKWIPISFRDWAGNEVYRTVTDEYGSYNALVPSTYTVNMPSPSGLMPSMVTVYLNHPFKLNSAGQSVPDPDYDPGYSQMAWTFMYSPGMASYLDTPIVPVGSFVGHPDFTVDVEPVDRTPKILKVSGNGDSSPVQKGPLLCADNDSITITAVGTVDVNNPAYSNEPGNTAPKLVKRDFGFGPVTGRVQMVMDRNIATPLSLDIVSWTNGAIVARAPAGTVSGGTLRTGQLYVVRGDNQKATEVGITLHVAPGCSGVVHVAAGGSVQAAIDGAAAGSLVMVPPGSYKEAVIIDRNIRLQGWGAESTELYAYPEPLDKLTEWHDKVYAVNVANGLGLGDEMAVQTLFSPIEMPAILVLRGPAAVDQANPSLVDGLRLTGSISGGGIQAFLNSGYLQISNNVITGNQGLRGGGIVVGRPDGVVNSNPGLLISHNRIVSNSGVTEGGGGISLFTGADNYTISGNRIAGNLTRWNGGGIAHFGYSDDGFIERNLIMFNEVFFGGQVGGEGGGIYIAGDGAGSGSVTIDANLIQGNLAGSGFGGGIRATLVNPAVDDPGSLLNIFNNFIVNNVATHGGGGISLQDVVNGAIVNNTVAHNDSTATAQAAMIAGVSPPKSDPQVAGIALHSHSSVLGGGYSEPMLKNNIIKYNRSYYWDGNLNSNAGDLVLSGYSDLGILGSSGTLPAARNNLLTAIPGGLGLDASNIAIDPQFLQPYYNNLLFGVVIDEGGNFISARFSPLTQTAGDYHLTAFSPAVNAGTDVVPDNLRLAIDYDTDTRHSGPVDIGADEYDFKGDINRDGTIGFADVLLALQIYLQLPTAYDANAGLADVAPVNLYNRPAGNGTFDLTDIMMLLYRASGRVTW